MKGIWLFGLNCSVDVWNDLKSYFNNDDMLFVQYPHEITKNAKKVSDITNWVYDKYKNEKVDYIVGHSMGGIVALEMVAEFGFKCNKVILIESNLRPAKEFYRNLMTKDNMNRYGERVMKMLKDERPFSSDELIKSLQENFDYSKYIKKYTGKIYGIYGDRGVKNYPNKISDFCLDKETEEKIKFYFVEDSCHMIMIENPKKLSEVIKSICSL